MGDKIGMPKATADCGESADWSTYIKSGATLIGAGVCEGFKSTLTDLGFPSLDFNFGAGGQDGGNATQMQSTNMLDGRTEGTSVEKGLNLQAATAAESDGLTKGDIRWNGEKMVVSPKLLNKLVDDLESGEVGPFATKCFKQVWSEPSGEGSYKAPEGYSQQYAEHRTLNELASQVQHALNSRRFFQDKSMPYASVSIRNDRKVEIGKQSYVDEDLYLAVTLDTLNGAEAKSALIGRARSYPLSGQWSKRPLED